VSDQGCPDNVLGVKTLRRRHDELALPLHVLLFSVLLVAALTSTVWLAVVIVALAIINDAVLTYEASERAMLLERLGAGPWVRAMLRSLLLVVTIGVATTGADLPVVLFGLIALTAHGCGLVVRTLMSLIVIRAPAIGVRNIGQDLRFRRDIDLANQILEVGGFLFLTLEWATFTGLSIAQSASASNRVLVAITVAGAVPAAAVTVVLLWRVRQALTGGAARYAAALHEELLRFAPECIVYMSADKAQSGYILNQWLPAFEAMHKRAVVLVREASNVGPIAETSMPVIFAPQTRHVERLALPSVRVAFYLANAGKNVHLLREPALQHLFLNHGDSDKSTSANPVSRAYDEVWVAGQAAIDRYHAAGVDIPMEDFAIVGRPQVDPLFVGPLRDSETNVVLYAPTWEGYYQAANYSSLEVMGAELIAALLAQRPDLAIIFKPHPASGMQRPGMRSARAAVRNLLRQSPHPQRHVIAEEHPGMTLNDCFDQADVLVSDVSSVVTDFLHTDRPIVITNPHSMAHETFRTTFPTQASSYILDLDLGSLTDLLDDALGDDPLAEQRSAMKRYVLGDLPEGPLRAFSNHVDRVYDEALVHAARVRNSFTISSLATDARGVPLP
jgi:CDP-Glycerol:Poly(glycerophosphate) glycerophosphotransferase